MTDELWEKYEELWNSDDFDAREKFAQFEALSTEIFLDILSSEGDLGILSALAANENLPAEIAQGMFEYEYTMSREEDSDLSIHRGLASNPSLSPQLLQELADSDDEEVAEIAQETLDSIQD